MRVAVIRQPSPRRGLSANASLSGLRDHGARPRTELAMAVAFVTHPHCLLHKMGDDHPERPARLRAIEDALHERGLHDLLVHHEAPRATIEQLARVHPRAYIEALAARSPASGYTHIDPDTWMSPETFEA